MDEMYRDDLLDGQTIFITGGGTGLGRSMAERFASLGARIGICGRREEPLEETCGAIRGAGGTAAWASCDVRDFEAVENAVDSLEDDLGPITGLVNNAAGNFLAPSEDLSPNAFDAVVRIVLHGTYHSTRAVARRWIKRDGDDYDPESGDLGHHVLSIVTTYAWMGSAFVLPSAAAKAGVLAMTRSLAIEWATYGIRSNAIAPGPFPTEGAFSRLMPEDYMEKAKKANPLGRFGDKSELADLATYLFSPSARYVNGECVTIDGGEWLKEGQEFSGFVDFPRQELKKKFEQMKPEK